MPSLVTVIIPVYGVEKYLENSVKSVINQTHKDLQIILVDDGSPDKCGEICDRLAKNDNRITVVHKPNGGVSSARNAGIQLAEGKWLYFIDADDTIEPDTISSAVNTAESTNTDMCFFDYISIINGKSSLPHNTLNTQDKVVRDLHSDKSLIAYNILCGSSCLFVIKTEYVKNKVFFDEKIAYGEDTLFKLACYAQIGSFSYLHEPKYNCLIRTDSACNSPESDYAQKACTLYDALTQMIEKYPYPSCLTEIINTHMINRISVMTERAFCRGGISGFFSGTAILNEFVDSPAFRNSLTKYQKKNLNKTARLLLPLINRRRAFTAAAFFTAKLKRVLKK